MLTRRFQKLKKRSKALSRKLLKKFFKKDTGKNNFLTCYKCNKLGHIKVEGPLLKNNQNKGKKVVKDEQNNDLSSLDSKMSNEKKTNIYLMVKDDLELIIIDNVSIENHSYKELKNFFEELYEKLEKLDINIFF